MRKVDSILKEVLSNVEPPKEKINEINNYVREFKKEISKEIKKLKIKADIFEGGSFAKKTLIKKNVYDVDLFIRFDEQFRNKDISKLTKKILKQFKNIKIIHGSRDYFQIKKSEDFFLEIVPVIKNKNPKEAENITDLSYSHVKYINKKLKNKQVLDEIKITKAFCYATQTYGAESYINGFSGYGIELLMHHYGSFLKFIKEVSKNKEEKIIIDIEKDYKNKNVLLDMNSSKLESPIILVDPTFKQRNALAALSEETLEKFKKECKKFLKRPSIKNFQIKKIDLNKVKENALKKKQEFILLEARTSKQEGDIAGSKLLKFYKHLDLEIQIFFEVKNKGFNYNHKKSARYFFVVKRRKELIFKGPFLKDKKNLRIFKRKHKHIITKKGKVYAKEKINISIDKFIEKWKRKYKKLVKDMSISDLKMIHIS